MRLILGRARLRYTRERPARAWTSAGSSEAPGRITQIRRLAIPQRQTEMAVSPRSPPRTPAATNGRGKNLTTPDILAAMMDSDSEDELVRS